MNENQIITLLGNVEMSVKVSRDQLAHAVWVIAWEMCGKPDDAGCDWVTHDNDHTYIAGSPEWKVSENPKVATLIRAMWVLNGHEPYHGRLEELWRDE